MAGSGFTVEEEGRTGPGESAPIWTVEVILAAGLGYLIGFVLTMLAAGPWQAVRDFAAEGLILILWLLVAQRLLKGQPEVAVPVSKPRLELYAGLAALAALITGAALFYLQLPWFIYGNLAILYLVPLLILIRQPDWRLALGLRWPPGRAWFVLLAVVGINLLVGIVLGNLLPPGELPVPAGADLAEELTSPLAVLQTIGQLALIAALPEELFFRVFLQPRLGRFLPAGWAILVQALLFSAAHLPQGLIRYGESWPLALAGLFTIANGVIGGYLWRRTRSLPFLIALHLFAYPRIGL